MTIEDFVKLPEAEKVPFHTDRDCPNCDGKLVRLKGHSAGDLHAVCPTCEFCPDCDEGE